MSSTSYVSPLRAVTAAIGAALAFGAALPAKADLTGNINVLTKYVLRGITNGGGESDTSVVQGGFDYSNSSGLYAGYWGSNLGYTGGDNNAKLSKGFENDLYGGYKGSAGSFSYGIGAIYYIYDGVENSDGTEITLSGGIGNASLGINYLTKDVVWGNKGDTYFNLGYSLGLPSDFSLAGNLMYYMYKKDGEFIMDDGTEKSNAFRGVSLTLSHPLGKTGGSMGLTVVGGGEDRFGVYQKFTPVLSLGMTF
jgi:uncharacterized protein (TIGR02001 family)